MVITLHPKRDYSLQIVKAAEVFFIIVFFLYT